LKEFPKVFKNKLAKNVVKTILLICTTISFTIFLGCEKNEKLDINNNEELLQILQGQVSTSFKKSTKSASLTEYEIFNNKNTYSDYARSIFSIAKKWTKDKSIASSLDFKGQFYDEINQIKTPECFNAKPSEIEYEVIHRLWIDLKGKTKYEIIIIFNNYRKFVENYICDDIQQDRILYTIETLKLICVQSSFDNSQISMLKSASDDHLLTPCQRDCMNAKMDDMNWFDWAVALALEGPPAWAVQMYISCVINCW